MKSFGSILHFHWTNSDWETIQIYYPVLWSFGRLWLNRCIGDINIFHPENTPGPVAAEIRFKTLGLMFSLLVVPRRMPSRSSKMLRKNPTNKISKVAFVLDSIFQESRDASFVPYLADWRLLFGTELNAFLWDRIFFVLGFTWTRRRHFIIPCWSHVE